MILKYPTIDVYKTGQNIKRIMELQGLTVRDLQIFLGFSNPQAIYHWYQGRSIPSTDNLYALSALFKVPMDTIIRGNKDNVSDPFQGPAYQRLRCYQEKLSKLKTA